MPVSTRVTAECAACQSRIRTEVCTVAVRRSLSWLDTEARARSDPLSDSAVAVDLQRETAGDGCFVLLRLSTVDDTKTAVAAECKRLQLQRQRRNQSCCTKRTFFHELSSRFEFIAHTGNPVKD